MLWEKSCGLVFPSSLSHTHTLLLPLFLLAFTTCLLSFKLSQSSSHWVVSKARNQLVLSKNHIAMGFSSFPIFLDPPNWSQMQQQPLQCLMSGGGGSDHDHHHHLIPPPSSQHQQQLAPLPCNNNPSNTNTATSGPPPSSLQHQQPSSGDPAAQPLAQAQAPSAQVAPSSGDRKSVV